MSAASEDSGSPRPDRRARRRQETIEEILDIAQQVMTEEGVNGLSISEVARRLGVQPPSLYKYFDSLMDLYDALFRRGQTAHLEVLRAARNQAKPGLDALQALFDASGRWCIANNPIAQLLFFRPVPSFEPSAESMAPSVEMIQLQRDALAEAVAAGQLGAAADSDEAIHVLSIFISGAVGQAIANDPDLPWGTGRYTPLLPRLLDLLVVLYPPRQTKQKTQPTPTTRANRSTAPRLNRP
jgi:AcrR family transcriptional regulator